MKFLGSIIIRRLGQINLKDREKSSMSSRFHTLQGANETIMSLNYFSLGLQETF